MAHFTEKLNEYAKELGIVIEDLNPTGVPVKPAIPGSTGTMTPSVSSNDPIAQMYSDPKIAAALQKHNSTREDVYRQMALFKPTV